MLRKPLVGAFFMRCLVNLPEPILHEAELTMSKKRFRFFRGQPVKTMRRDGDMLVLIFVSAIKGKPGRRIRITEDEWNDHGEWREVDSVRMDDLRSQVVR